MVAMIGRSVVFDAVKEAMFPLPLAAKLIEG